jgi:nucleotide-binding universal stress UspA family protein
MKILLAVDDSKFSEAAVQAVAARNWAEEVEVHVLHVVEPALFSVGGEMGAYISDIEAVREARINLARELVARVARTLRVAGLSAGATVEEGDPKTKIMECAAKWHADLIVVGSHGRKGLQRLVLGSVSEAVARHASCSVEIVRMPPELQAAAA